MNLGKINHPNLQPLYLFKHENMNRIPCDLLTKKSDAQVPHNFAQSCTTFHTSPKQHKPRTALG